MLPDAHVTHAVPRRLRIKVPSRKKDSAFFEGLQEQLSRHLDLESVQVNPMTGSVLLTDARGIDLDAVRTWAEERELFRIHMPDPEAGALEGKTLAQKVAEPFQRLDTRIKNFTGGQIDIPTVAFVYLVLAGLYQVNKGSLAAPSWYTAFWYAFSLFLAAGLGQKR